MMETKGIFLMIWGKKEYGYAAHNFALSLRAISPSLPVTLLSDQSALKGCTDQGLFDQIMIMPTTPNDPALCKMQVYDKLPYDHTLFMDVDALCINDLEPVMEQCMSDERDYRCAVHTWYDKDSPDIMPLMVWAKRSTIWDHYHLNGQKLPATQSSIQYIRKGDFCQSLFGKMQANYANKIPLEKLHNKWGGGQPDELYLNITLAQMGYDPTMDNVIYFGDDNSLKFSKIKESGYKILSLFGTARNIKQLFVTAYDNELKKMGNEHGVKPVLWKYISSAKIANVKSSPQRKNDGLGRGAFAKRFFPVATLDSTPINGTVHLFTSYFQSGNSERQSELDFCMFHHIHNPDITKIFNLGTPFEDESGKVVNIAIERPTYQDFIDCANDHPANYSIIVNSDIYLDQTIRWIDKVQLNGVMIALCRYDVSARGVKLFAYSHSQDTWIFKGKISVTGCDYKLGVPGCDNRFAYDVQQQGYKVVNTAKDIKTYHKHDSNVRSYTQEDRLEGNYQPILITSILELAQPKLLLIQPGKVGDIIICLPIAKYYADQGYDVKWECPLKYHSLFNYVDYCTPIERRSGEYKKTVDLSFGINTLSPVHKMWMQRRPSLDSFVTLKYELAEVPISEARKLTYNRNLERENELYSKVVTSHPYKLVHRISDYGSGIDVLGDAVIDFAPVEDYTIFDWRKVIESASEIHCIDSSLLNFVDCLEVFGKLMYYPNDKVPLQADRTILTKKWEVIEYANS